jgi:omega-hydroxy-beta-dihydromenaquinone-9 sulfotransferase
MPRRRSFLPALPYPHFMAFAPLDVWARLLFFPYAFIPPRYWLRMAFGIFTSAIGTAITLPERLILGPVLWWKARRSGARLAHEPGALVILGYYRSGTTHLHYLLSCDPQFRTPKWCEALAPQGFLLSWTFLRIFMIPFVSAKRPQDDVAIGPEWPAEDDFALCNAAVASSLPGRFILPHHYDHYSKFHALEGLSEPNRKRWRFAQWAFCWKLARLAPNRRLLLKTPSHTARVRELVDLFGPGRVRFIHIRRDDEAVIRSNIAMHSRLHVYNLQEPPIAEVVEGRIIEEYARTQALYAAQAAELPQGQLVEIRYEDLVADPLGQTRLAYAQLGLEWSPEFERRAHAYLDSVRDYRAATPAAGDGRAPRPAADTLAPERPRTAFAAAVLLTLALVLGSLWVGQAYMLRTRSDWAIWPIGIILGYASMRAARIGTTQLGILAAAATLLVYAGAAIPATFLSDYFQRPYYRGLPMRDWEWYHILKSARVGALAKNNMFWLFMGAVTAYRFASRKNLRPPGN